MNITQYGTMRFVQIAILKYITQYISTFDITQYIIKTVQKIFTAPQAGQKGRNL